jgi:hypothetical protein
VVAELPHSLASDLLSLGITYVVVNRDEMRWVADAGSMLEARGFRLLVQTETRALYAVGGGS